MSVRGKNIKKALERIGTKIVLEARWNIDDLKGTTKSGQNYTRALRKSLNFDIKEFNDKYVLEILSDKRAEKYADVIDKGRRPTKGGGNGTLRRVLEKWVVKNRLKLKDRRGRFKTLNKRQVKDLAFVIARKIHNKGFKGSGYLTNAFKSTADYVDDKIVEAYKLDLSQEVDTMFSQIKSKI